MKIIELLRGAGCKLRHYGSYLTCSAKYRGGDDPGSVVIYLNKNIAKDFVTGRVFSIEDFLRATLQYPSTQQFNNILDDVNCFSAGESSENDPFNGVPRVFSSEEIKDLEIDNSYWNHRGISAETLSIFKGGVSRTGKMYNRYVFPIFDARQKIQGFSGRDISGKSKIKWKHVGCKSEWAYPFYFNYKVIRDTREIILVESIGDMLSLWESGIKNTGVTFGTDINKGLLRSIIRLDPQKIIIATNNDKNLAGQKASRKIMNKLSQFFDPDQLTIRLPLKNDFGEQTLAENLEWYNLK
jgi:5S rRNA maturation endonuclease (ribonuclease M5)